jgi:SulP family sulfate permease
MAAMAEDPFLHFEPRVKNWQSYLPLLGILRRYQRADFSHDLVAGLVVGVITVPQAIAYAFLAGLPPQAGLYACLAPMVIYAILGSSKHLVVGPVALAALMVAATVSEHAPQHSDAYLGITTVLCLQAGIILWLLRLTKMGGVVNLLSHPVITGFINAAAFLIIVSQLNAFTGIPNGQATDPFARTWALLTDLGSLNPVTLAIGLATILLLWTVRIFGVRVARYLISSISLESPIARAGPALAAVLGILIVSMGDLDTLYGVATVGLVPSGLPELTIPPFDLDLWLELAPASAMIALVAFVESYSVGTSLATKERTRLNSHQELIALGAANIGAAFTGAYPVAGSFSRSSVNYQSGARTPVSSLVCMVVIVLTLLLFTPLFANLPQATLAAIVMVSVVGLVDLSSIVRHWKIYRQDSITEIVTLGTVLVFGVEAGLITGVALSIAFFVRRSSRPHLTLVGRIVNTEQFRAAKRYDVETFEHVAAVRIDENIYFANANNIESKLQKIVQRRPQTRHVLLVCSAVNIVDISGIEMLLRFNDNLQQLGVKLHLSDVKAPVMAQFESSEFPVKLSGSVFFTTDQAMRDLAERS